MENRFDHKRNCTTVPSPDIQNYRTPQCAIVIFVLNKNTIPRDIPMFFVGYPLGHGYSRKSMRIILSNCTDGTVKKFRHKFRQREKRLRTKQKINSRYLIHSGDHRIVSFEGHDSSDFVHWNEKIIIGFIWSRCLNLHATRAFKNR